jgi:protein SCO1/2
VSTFTTILKGAAFVALAAAALSGGFAAWKRLQPVPTPPPEISGYLLQQPREIPSFALLDGDGATFTNDGFKGAWSFLYFGYTYCPDVCPTSMIALAILKQALEQTHPDLVAHYYLVSVDPARDTPERLREYVAYFDPTFRGVTGERDEIDKLAGAASVIYVIPESAPGVPYLVGHSSTITLIDPGGNVHAIFTSPFMPNQIAADFAKVEARYGARR